MVIRDHRRGRLFPKGGGGDDTAQPTVVAISCTSSWTSKVNSIHYAIPIHIPLNGLLPHAPSCDYARLDLMSTGAWEEATSIRGLKADVREAWKRRRKKTSARWPESPPHTSRSLRPSRSIRRTPAGYSARPASTSTRPRVTRLGSQIGYFPETTRSIRPDRTVRRARTGYSGRRWALGPCTASQTSQYLQVCP